MALTKPPLGMIQAAGAAGSVLTVGTNNGVAATTSSGVSPYPIDGGFNDADGTLTFLLSDGSNISITGMPTTSSMGVGITGAAGINGINGTDGTDGKDGAVGATGGCGPQGVVGPAGPAGIVGPDGPAGTIGPMGQQGPPGTYGATGYTRIRWCNRYYGCRRTAGIGGQIGLPGPIGTNWTNWNRLVLTVMTVIPG